MLIYPEHHSVFEWRPELVPGYAGPVISGSDAFSGCTEKGCINLQEFLTAECHLQFGHFQLNQEEVLSLHSAESGLFSHAQLCTRLVTSLGGIGTAELREGAYNLVKAVAPQYECLFNARKEYQMLLLHYRPAMLQQLEPMFPKLCKGNAIKPMVFTRRSSFINHHMQQVISQIINHPFDSNTAALYLEGKIREYLLVMLQHVFRVRLPRYRFAQRDIDKLTEARRLLLQDLQAKPLTIAELAKACGLNEFKLKLGFRQLFDNSVFGCLHDARMNKARELLINTDKPLKEICVMTGYPRITNFITAFRRHFGRTPGWIRRNS